MLDLSLGLDFDSRMKALSSYNPLTVNNCICWLDGTDPVASPMVSGTIPIIYDKSGSGNNGVQATAVRQATEIIRSGVRTMSYDGSRWYDLPGLPIRDIATGNFTIFITGRSNLITGEQKILSGRIGGSHLFAVSYLNSTTLLGWCGGWAPLAVVRNTSGHLITYYRSGVNHSVMLDGVTASTADVVTQVRLDGVTLGRTSDSISQFWNGEIDEVLIYNRLLDANERAYITAGMRAKSGL